MHQFLVGVEVSLQGSKLPSVVHMKFIFSLDKANQQTQRPPGYQENPEWMRHNKWSSQVLFLENQFIISLENVQGISCICLATERRLFFAISWQVPVISITFRFNGYSIVKIVFFLLFLCGEIFWVGKIFFPLVLILCFVCCFHFLCLLSFLQCFALFLYLFILYWSIAGEQCCHSFRQTVKGNQPHIRGSILPHKLPSVQVATEY